MKLSPRLLNLTLVLASVVVSLLIVELLFRIASPAFSKPPPPSGRPSRYYLPEGTITERDYDYSPTKPPSTFRIIVIGDSFTFAGKVQFDDSFSKKLERLLNLNNTPLRAEVLNAGASGHGTKDEVALVKDALERYQPDLILLQITLNDAELQTFHSANPGRDRLGRRQVKHPLFNYWKSGKFVLQRIYNSISHWEYPEYFQSLFRDPQGLEIFNSSLAEIKQLTDAHQTKLAAVIFPLFYGSLDTDYKFLNIHELIKSKLKSLGVPVLDLLRAYWRIPVELLQVIPGVDLHPNELGHRLAADSLYRFLAKNSLLPSELIIRHSVDSKHEKSARLPEGNPELAFSSDQRTHMKTSPKSN